MVMTWSKMYHYQSAAKAKTFTPCSSKDDFLYRVRSNRNEVMEE